MRTMRSRLQHAAVLAAVLAGPPANLAIAADRQDLATVKIAERRNGPCLATVTRGGSLHVVKITGLEPDEAFDLKLTYEGRVLILPIVAPSKGVVVVALESNVRGESIGVGYVDFDASRCRVHFSYPWRSKT